MFIVFKDKLPKFELGEIYTVVMALPNMKNSYCLNTIIMVRTLTMYLKADIIGIKDLKNKNRFEIDFYKHKENSLKDLKTN